MEADWSVEMGRDDDVLEFPWSSEDQEVRYWDLRGNPAALAAISEAAEHRPLHDTLAAINSGESPFQTVKCDVWQSQPEPGCNGKDSGASTTWSSYVDVVFTDESSQLSFPAHEALARYLSRHVQAQAEASGEVEFIVRRCFYHRGNGEMEPGCHITCYAHGFADNNREAYENWAAALGCVQRALKAFAVGPESQS